MTHLHPIIDINIVSHSGESVGQSRIQPIGSYADLLSVNYIKHKELERKSEYGEQDVCISCENGKLSISDDFIEIVNVYYSSDMITIIQYRVNPNGKIYTIKCAYDAGLY